MQIKARKESDNTTPNIILYGSHVYVNLLNNALLDLMRDQIPALFIAVVLQTVCWVLSKGYEYSKNANLQFIVQEINKKILFDYTSHGW